MKAKKNGRRWVVVLFAPVVLIAVALLLIGAPSAKAQGIWTHTFTFSPGVGGLIAGKGPAVVNGGYNLCIELGCGHYGNDTQCIIAGFTATRCAAIKFRTNGGSDDWGSVTPGPFEFVSYCWTGAAEGSSFGAAAISLLGPNWGTLWGSTAPIVYSGSGAASGCLGTDVYPRLVSDIDFVLNSSGSPDVAVFSVALTGYGFDPFAVYVTATPVITSTPITPFYNTSWWKPPCSKTPSGSASPTKTAIFRTTLFPSPTGTTLPTRTPATTGTGVFFSTPRPSALPSATRAPGDCTAPPKVTYTGPPVASAGFGDCESTPGRDPSSTITVNGKRCDEDCYTLIPDINVGFSLVAAVINAAASRTIVNPETAIVIERQDWCFSYAIYSFSLMGIDFMPLIFATLGFVLAAAIVSAVMAAGG